MEDHVDCWSRLETAASPDGAIFSVSVADDPDEFCIDKAISRQSHRLLTSEDVVREKLLLAQKKADKEQKKAEANLKRELCI
jgi:hypothetical protein